MRKKEDKNNETFFSLSLILMKQYQKIKYFIVNDKQLLIEVRLFLQ